MDQHEDRQATQSGKRAWARYILLALIIEKIIQHVVVTIALGVDLGGIRSTVAVNPDLLMVAGAVVGALFVLSLWGMIARSKWAINLVIALALFDMVGEFIAQGRVDIVITVSFIVATLLFILALRYRRQEQRRALP